MCFVACQLLRFWTLLFNDDLLSVSVSVWAGRMPYNRNANLKSRAYPAVAFIESQSVTQFPPPPSLLLHHTSFFLIVVCS
jgi:hypothetical protein